MNVIVRVRGISLEVPSNAEAQKHARLILDLARPNTISFFGKIILNSVYEGNHVDVSLRVLIAFCQKNAANCMKSAANCEKQLDWVSWAGFQQYLQHFLELEQKATLLLAESAVNGNQLIAG